MAFRRLIAVILVGTMLAGCATTATTASPHSEWNLQTVGRGLQDGAMASAGNAGIFGPILLGFGIMLEQLGIAINQTGWWPPRDTKTEIGPRIGGG